MSWWASWFISRITRMLVMPIATRSTAITRKPARSFVWTVARILATKSAAGRTNGGSRSGSRPPPFIDGPSTSPWVVVTSVLSSGCSSATAGPLVVPSR